MSHDVSFLPQCSVSGFHRNFIQIQDSTLGFPRYYPFFPCFAQKRSTSNSIHGKERKRRNESLPLQMLPKLFQMRGVLKRPSNPSVPRLIQWFKFTPQPLGGCTVMVHAFTTLKVCNCIVQSSLNAPRSCTAVSLLHLHQLQKASKMNAQIAEKTPVEEKGKKKFYSLLTTSISLSSSKIKYLTISTQFFCHKHTPSIKKIFHTRLVPRKKRNMGSGKEKSSLKQNSQKSKFFHL